MRRWHLSRGGAVFVALVATLGVGGCATNPATGERQISLIGEGQEIQMGRESDEQVVQTMGLYGDQALQQYVQTLGAQLAASSERPDLPWTFRVVDDPAINAFAIPGGFVYVTRGLLTHLRSEAELVGVLGHEIGHITAKHSVSQISRQQLASLGVGIGMVLVPQLRPFGDIAGAGMQLLFLRFSRDNENQADELGVRYMTRLSFDPHELADVMTMLERSSELQGNNEGSVPQWLSTHPNPGNRAAHIEQLVAANGVPANAQVRRNEYLRRLDGMTFGEDPREGFFTENVFHHPGMGFRFTFPRGWATANTKQAVQSISPNQDAALMITLAEGTPSQAASQFGSQSGVQVTRSGQQNLSGTSGVVTDFVATSSEGAFVGSALFVSHGGSTFRVLGYAPEARWGGYQTAVRQAMASFTRETDPQVLNVRSNVIDVVTLNRSMTLQTFMQQYPSVAPAEIVALINGLESGATLPSGTLAKRVIQGPS